MGQPYRHVQIEYPNEGVYSDGKPRYTVRVGPELVFCREATDEEVYRYELLHYLQEIAFLLRDLRERAG